MPNQVSHDSKGIFQIIDSAGAVSFLRPEGVVQAGSPDVAGWETSYLITAKLNPAGQGGAVAGTLVVPAQTVDGSTGVYNRS